MMWNTLRLAAGAAIMTLGLAADSTAPSVTLGTGFDGCLGPGPVTCNPIEISVFPFDTSLGTLDSIDWTVNANQQVDIDIDNCTYGPPPLISYSFSITTGDSLLGSSSTYTTGPLTGTTYGGCAGEADLKYNANLQFQGVVTSDFSQFMDGVETTPFVESGTITTSSYVGSAFFIGSEGDDLTVVYNYTPFSSVPEPRNTALVVIAALGGIALVLKRRSLHRKIQ